MINSQKTKNLILQKNSIISLFLIALICVICVLLSSMDYSRAVSAFCDKKLPIYSVETEEKILSISFDCAWGDAYTDKILEELDRYNVKATFFAVKFWVEKYPEKVKKIVEKGHELGTHSSTHPKMSKLTAPQIIEELNSSSQAIEKITNRKVTLFRPPFGDYNDRLIVTARDNGYEPIQWDVDSLDWKDLSAQDIAFRVISKAKNGSIILCHNNGLHTAESLPLIFTDLMQKGYKFVPISSLIIKQPYYIDNNGRQFAKN